MPYKCQKIKIEGTKNDTRIKVTPEMKEDILQEKGKLSQRKTARKYGISRRTVIFIWYPERLERNKELHKERRKDGRYYDRKKNTLAQRKHRRRKQKLYVEGVIKFRGNNHGKDKKAVAERERENEEKIGNIKRSRGDRRSEQVGFRKRVKVGIGQERVNGRVLQGVNRLGESEDRQW
jgi:hypothetical protein